jgi:protoporphyrinogen oxidase
VSQSDNWSRRKFVAALGLAPALIGLSHKTERVITGGFVEDDSTVGHQLRDGKPFVGAREHRKTSVAIIGAGIGGLSAGWRLDALGMRDWLLLELGAEVGGNARGGENGVSKFPWGAHYVPVPGANASHVRDLFREMGILDANGVWDERTLCHSPQERLFQHGRWHEGLEPVDGLPKWERDEFARWDAFVREWRATGAFRVPMGDVRSMAITAKVQRELHTLDSQNAQALLQSQNFKSRALRWWVEYGARDDYGASLQQVSAWSAVHYFAARGAEELGPLTWPEGNYFVVKHLASRAGARVTTTAPVYAVQRRGSKWFVRTPSVDVLCDVVIWAAPLFVLPHVIPEVRVPVTTEYAPWVVANITLDHAPDERTFPLAWDNVIYDSQSLGYVDATHQQLGETGPRTVWTWYHAAVDRAANDARVWLRDEPWTAWRDYIVADLSRAHPDIKNSIARIDVRRWGHAMARPVPGVLDRMATLRAWTPAKRLFVAHADMTGFSLFEEAQWHGITAANAAAKVIQG